MQHAVQSPTFSFSDHGNDARLRELVVYLAQKCAGDERFGATKLNKILYFSDFLSYQRRGKSITGAGYWKLERGPAPRQMLQAKDYLIHERAIEEIPMMFHGYRQKRVVAKRAPNLALFTGDDIALVDEVVEILKDHSAADVSRMSHNIAWKIAGPKGSIPYESVFLSDTMPTDADVEWAKAQNIQHGWNA